MCKKKKILIVEDEPNLAQGLKFNLEVEGYQTDVLETAEEAQQVFSNYDLLVLDVMLPGMNGIELLKNIRQQDYIHPVLILSAKASEEDLISGLAAGADDYLTKPFSLPELLLRIKRILERHSWAETKYRITGLYSFGSYWVDFNTLEANTNNGKKSLTLYESMLMRFLIENKDRTVSRDELLQKVWGYDQTPQTRTVDIFIARLRKMFEQDAKTPIHIRSIRGVGYRFYKE